MHKIESIQTGEKKLEHFIVQAKDLNRGPPGSYSSVLTTTLTILLEIRVRNNPSLVCRIYLV